MDAEQIEKIEQIAGDYKDKPEQLMRLLLQIQAIAGNAVPNEVAVIVSRVTGIPKSRIYGYITFYAQKRSLFYLRRPKRGGRDLRGTRH